MCLDDPFLRTFSAFYTDGEKFASIGIMSYEGEPVAQVEKTDSSVETTEKNGRTFYLIQNTGNYTIAWYTDQYEYYLSSNDGEDILWQVAESMFT